MRRFRAALAATAALAVGVLTPCAGAQTQLELTEVNGARFPDRAFILTLPSRMPLDEGRVAVRENGELVEGVGVVPASAADDGQFSVVLVMDTSLSMRGRPIDGAVAAVRAFAARRNDNQAMAIVGFNGKTSVLLPFTTSEEAIDRALESSPRLAGGTKIYDGVNTALMLLEAAKASAGSVIVLSDGADTGSTTSASAVVDRAERNGVRVFSVGLRSRAFTSKPLEQLAAATSGGYAEATTSEDLEPVFDKLGAQLANEYFLTYRSNARPETRVHVTVTVEGIDGAAVRQYETPAGPDGASGPFHRSFAERFLRSAAGMVATSVAFALLVALAVAALVRPRKRTLRARMAQFVALTVAERKDGPGHSDVVLSRAEKSFARTRWWSRFKEELEIAGIKAPAVQIVLWTVVATVLVTWLVYVVTGSLLFALAGLAIPYLVRSFVKKRLNRQRNLFADQLPDNLQVLSSALRAGHSLVGALSVLVDDCPEPSRGEFRRVLADEQLGVSVDRALGAVARRMTSRDLEQVALVAALQRDTGGNTAEVLDRVAETVRGRFELRRLVRTLTTQGRMSRWVVSFLPVGMLALITLINPAYMAPLFSHPAGRVLLFVAGVMVVAGSLVIKRIINIKV
jgi:tight adherence protein B